jgi:predicted lactoylglutathione lyase
MIEDMVPARISAVILVTDRLAEQRAFYESLGWSTPAPPDATFVPFALAGAALVLTTADAACDEAGVDHRFAALTGMRSADAVDAGLAAATEAGGEVVQAGRERPFGHGGWFRDPDGNLWELAFAPEAAFGAPPSGGGDGLVARLNTLTVVTREVMPLRRFYERLGFRSLMEDRDDIVQFQVSGAVFSCWVEHEALEHAGAALGGAHPGFELGIVVESPEEVDAQIEVVRAAGARVLTEPGDEWWGGRSSYFTDPDGNVLEVVHIPSASLNERGELVLGGG